MAGVLGRCTVLGTAGAIGVTSNDPARLCDFAALHHSSFDLASHLLRCDARSQEEPHTG